MLGEEAAAGKVPDQGAVEDELLDVLGQRQLGDGDLELGRTGLLLGELGGQTLASNGSRETSRDSKADKISRLGPDAVEPKRIKDKKFAR